jgi:hypothetical protein
LQTPGLAAFFRVQPSTKDGPADAGPIPYDHERYQRNQPERLSTPRRRHRQRPLPGGPPHPADFHLTDHLNIHKKDFSSRRGLLTLVSQRRKLLDYIKKGSEEKYQEVIKGLGLRR